MLHRPWLDENSRDRTSRRVLTRRDEALLRACIGVAWPAAPDCLLPLSTHEQGDENGAKTAIKYGANIDCVDEVTETTNNSIDGQG